MSGEEQRLSSDGESDAQTGLRRLHADTARGAAAQ